MILRPICTCGCSDFVLRTERGGKRLKIIYICNTCDRQVYHRIFEARQAAPRVCIRCGKKTLKHDEVFVYDTYAFNRMCCTGTCDFILPREYNMHYDLREIKFLENDWAKPDEEMW